MKNIFLLLFFLPFTLKADLGSVVLFKAKFVLKSGISFVGYYELNDMLEYEILKENSQYRTDIGFQKLLNQKSAYNNYKVILFKDYYIEPQTNFAFLSEKKIINLHLDSLKYTIFYTAFMPNYNFKRLNIVSDSVFFKIKNSKLNQYVNFENGTSSSNVLSFNPKFSWKETLKMTADVCEYLINLQINEKKYSSKTIQKFEARIKELEQQNVFIFTFYYPC